MNICANLGIASKSADPLALQACSACAGDYEDPDRTSDEETAETDTEENEEELKTEQVSVEDIQ